MIGLRFSLAALILFTHFTSKIHFFVKIDAKFDTKELTDSVYHNQLGPRPRQRLEAPKSVNTKKDNS